MSWSASIVDKTKAGVEQRLIDYAVQNHQFPEDALQAALSVLRFSSEPPEGWVLVLVTSGHADDKLCSGSFATHFTRDRA